MWEVWGCLRNLSFGQAFYWWESEFLVSFGYIGIWYWLGNEMGNLATCVMVWWKWVLGPLRTYRDLNMFNRA